MAGDSQPESAIGCYLAKTITAHHELSHTYRYPKPLYAIQNEGRRSNVESNAASQA